MKYVVVVKYLDAHGTRESLQILSEDSYDSFLDALDELKEIVMDELQTADFMELRWQNRFTLRVTMPTLGPPYRERVYKVTSLKYVTA